MTKPLTQPKPNPASLAGKTPPFQPDLSQDISIEIITLHYAFYRLFQLALSDHPLQPPDLWKLVFIHRMLAACLSRLSRLAPNPTPPRTRQDDAISRAISHVLAEMAAGFPH